ncbi:MAG: hypothetical protein IJW99_11040 [Clostridia bacterium]|nr:hypothetical protein [Clostridia bacterium]
MNIHSNLIGGNIAVDRIENDTVYLERELRDTEGDWFYWAFCVEGAAGRTLTFVFPSKHRVGRFGAAVSHDLREWHWSESGSGDTFTYTFAEGEDKVYFAHNMLYHPAHFDAFCARVGLKQEVFCRSVKGRDLPAVRFGTGKRWILLTARHHACEATGNYVLEGVTETLLSRLPEDFAVLVVPFVDYDGVVDGDQGKNRRPHDHNRDYTDAPIYEVVEKMMTFGREHDLCYTFDFHSPWHMGKQNDYVFFSRSTEAMEPRIDLFAEYMKQATAAGELKYTGAWDVGPNEAWNNETSPNSKNYFSKQPSVRLSITTETPYFGVTDGSGKISQDAMRALGRVFGHCILQYPAQDGTV